MGNPISMHVKEKSLNKLALKLTAHVCMLVHYLPTFIIQRKEGKKFISLAISGS